MKCAWHQRAVNFSKPCNVDQQPRASYGVERQLARPGFTFRVVHQKLTQHKHSVCHSPLCAGILYTYAASLAVLSVSL